jgi:hypothetical protein
MTLKESMVHARKREEAEAAGILEEVRKMEALDAGKTAPGSEKKIEEFDYRYVARYIGDTRIRDT